MLRERETHAPMHHLTRQILVESRTTFGVTRVYPICAGARRLADIAGTKTLTEATLEDIRRLGFSVVDRTAIGARVARSVTSAAF